MSFDYGFYGMRNNVYNQTLNDIENILSSYECPEFCKGRCCKMSSIIFQKDEYDKMLTFEEEKTRVEIINHTTEVKNLKAKLMSQGIPKKAAKAKAKRVQYMPYEFDSIICPLLNNGKCKIYDLRPNVCKHYPFKFEHLKTKSMVGVIQCFLGEALYFDYILMYCDIYAKNYNKKYENIILSDLVHLKRNSEQAKEYQNYLLNSQEGDIIINPPGIDKAFLNLNLLARYLSKINGDVLQHKRNSMKAFLQNIQFTDEQVKFGQDNYSDFINKINEFADPLIYIELYKDAYMIDNSDLKTAKM